MKYWLLTLPLIALLSAPSIGAGEDGVEILRDTWGVPHVFAHAEADGFFGLGYVCAEDPRLQMELIRRKGAGRLAEVFGPEWVNSDRAARIAGHAEYVGRAFTRLPERWQQALRAYSAGVNAWGQKHPEAVSRRFGPLGVLPEPWTPADCLLAARGVLALGSPFDDESVRSYHRFRELAEQVGEAEAAQQSDMVIDASVVIVPESEMAKDKAVSQRLKQRPRMPGFTLHRAGSEGPKMSHAWAVSGGRSTTGKPILESDPQLPICSPANNGSRSATRRAVRTAAIRSTPWRSIAAGCMSRLHGGNNAGERAHAHRRFLSPGAGRSGHTFRLCARVWRHQSRSHRRFLDRHAIRAGRSLHGRYGDGSRLPV